MPDAPVHRASDVDEIERRLIVRGGHMVARNFSTMYHDLKVLTPCPLPAGERGSLLEWRAGVKRPHATARSARRSPRTVRGRGRGAYTYCTQVYE